MRDPVLTGYTRPLEATEDVAADIEILERAGAERIVVEESRASLIEFKGWLAQSQPGDTLLVTDLERLNGSVTNIVRSLLHLQSRSLYFRCLGAPVFDTWSPELVAVLTALNEVNHGLRSRSTREGIAGKRPGRPPALSPDEVAMAKELRNVGRPYAQIATVLGVSVNTIKRAIARRST
ncbi:recombinase family protein [Microbacterium sp.]|uniref:recombinase family protein n=1 Tax=Microbacterium sp. TaxID=51671 RepID=UPI003C22833D